MPREGRWDWLEGVQRQPLEQALVREAGKAMADELLAWPPQVQFYDPHTSHARALAGDPPTAAALALAFRLAGHELRREFDARDQILRGDAFDRLGNADDVAAARFVAGWLTEWLLELAERVQSRLSRTHLLDALAITDARVRSHRAQAS